MSKKLTQEEVTNIIKEKLGENYIQQSPYINKTSKLKILHKPCGNIYDASINNIDCGFGLCPTCRPKARKYTQESFIEKVKQIDPNIKVISPYTTSYNKMTFLYVPDNQEFITTPQEIYKKVGYPFSRACNGAKPKVGINDMWSTHPKEAECLVNKEDGYNYPFGTNTELDFECPICKKIFTGTPRSLFRNNGEIKCNCCSDGFSYPEKLMSNILEELNIDYIYQLNSSNGFSWCKNYRYDFYLPKYNTIIETHGMQHYTQKWKTKSLDEIKQNDINKKDTALTNGVRRYIIIDCSHTKLNYIKNSILKSELSEMFDFDNLDWKSCDRKACNSKMKQVCKDYIKGVSLVELQEKYNICAETVRRYIQRAKENNLIIA